MTSQNNSPDSGVSIETPDDIVDLEECAKTGRVPAPARRYRIRIDKQYFIVTVPSMTGRQLLELAGKVPPERYRLDEKLRGGRTHQIALSQVVEFARCETERFLTLPLDQTEGTR